MTPAKVKELDHGLYRLAWKKSAGGGYSLAAVGSNAHGDRWFAATNWLGVPSFDWRKVQSAELLIRR